VNAKKFFRMEVSISWGHLVRERKTLTKREENVREAVRAYRDGIKKAWEVYTEDNMVVKEAKKTLDSEIDEAYKSCLPERGEKMSQTEYEKANRLYLKTLSKIHAKFADTIGQIWGVFMKDMETSSWLTKKRI
jgi:5-methylthioribose kinase